jgi:hypothetical protein
LSIPRKTPKAEALDSNFNSYSVKTWRGEPNMKMSNNILTQVWEQAALEQIALDYQSQGYSTKKQVKIADMQADLVAQKDNDVIFFELKSGKWDNVKINQALKLRNYVVQNKAGQFKLVLVNRPQEKRIEIVDKVAEVIF